MTEQGVVHALYGLFIISVFPGWFYILWQESSIDWGQYQLRELQERVADVHELPCGVVATRTIVAD